MEEAQRLLEDQQRRAESLRTRGGQPFATIAAEEITNYASDRFLTETDLWRVHVRSLRALEKAARATQEDGNTAAKTILRSLYVFLAGLEFSLISLATLTLESI